MKFLDRFNLVIFSIIILVLAMIICFLSFNWIDVDLVIDGVKCLVYNKLVNNIALVISIILIGLSMISIFFSGHSKDNSKGKDGILLENDSGKLLVSKSTIESLANTVVKSFGSAENATTKVEVDQENHVKIYITLFVYPDAIIKELSNKLQTNVKDTIKKSLDLEITEVNIRIKDISVKKEINIKE